MVKLLYFARLRERLDCATESLELPAGVSTVGALRLWLAGRGGEWQAALAQDHSVRVAVNQDMASDATPVQDHDEVAFFPPVTGG